jgi:hypothetical protein
MQAVAIDQGCHGSSIDYIDATTDQGKAIFRQIDHLRRLRDATVTFGRGDIRWLRRHQGLTVPDRLLALADEVIE